MFHRQGEDFISTAIKDTLPYFLGAYDEEHLLKQAHLDQARRELRILERQVRDSEVVENNTFPRARALMDEAKGIGLIDDRTTATTYEATLETLVRVATQSTLRDEMVIADENEILASLRAERQGLRNELEQVNEEIRSTRNFTTETNGYEREAKEQRARLSSVGLVHGDGPNTVCPVCKSHLPQPVPTATQINLALQTLSLQLQTVEAENPRLLQRLASLEKEAALIQERLQENQQRIAARVRENEMLKSQQDTYVLQARTLGKIMQYIESVSTSEMSASLQTQVELARSHVAVLEQELDPDAARERLDTFLNFIGRYMTDYSDRLDLEHHGSRLRLDIRSLTVIADTLNGAGAAIPHGQRRKLGWIPCIGPSSTAQVVPAEKPPSTWLPIFGSTLAGTLPTRERRRGRHRCVDERRPDGRYESISADVRCCEGNCTKLAGDCYGSCGLEDGLVRAVGHGEMARQFKANS